MADNSQVASVKLAGVLTKRRYLDDMWGCCQALKAPSVRFGVSHLAPYAGPSERR